MEVFRIPGKRKINIFLGEMMTTKREEEGDMTQSNAHIYLFLTFIILVLVLLVFF